MTEIPVIAAGDGMCPNCCKPATAANVEAVACLSELRPDVWGCETCGFVLTSIEVAAQDGWFDAGPQDKATS